MRKTLLSIAVLFQLITVFGQSSPTMQTNNGSKGLSGTAGAMQPTRQYIPTTGRSSQNNATNAGSSDNWITDNCYKGIQYKIFNWGKVSGNYSDYYWGIIFKNTYSKPVSFAYHLSVGGENLPTQYNHTVTYKIAPNGVYNNDGSKASAILFKSNSDNYVLSIKDVCLGECENNSFINCEGVKMSSNTSNSNSSSNNQYNTNSTTTTQPQQNDLTEYYRSKADLERQMAEKNAEIQLKSENYTKAINAGVAANNAGNYDEAKRQFTIAINNSNTQEARAKAQEYYDKVVKFQKTANIVNTAKVAVPAITDLVKAFRDDKREKKERERLANEEREEQDKLKQKQYLDSKNQNNKLLDSKNFAAWCDFLTKEMEAIGYEFDSIKTISFDKNEKYTSMIFNGVELRLKHSFLDNKMENDINFFFTNNDALQKFTNSQLKTLLQASASRMSGGNIYKLAVFFSNVNDLEKEDKLKAAYGNDYVSTKYLGFSNYCKQSLAVLGSNDYSIKTLKEKGKIYRYGIGLERDYSDAIYYYTLAGQQGDGESLCAISFMYFSGDSYVPKDIAKAKEYAQKAIDIGYLDGYTRLAKTYFGEKEYAKGVETLEKGIALGHAMSALTMAIAYEIGDYGLAKNNDLALKYYEKACEFGKDDKICKRLDEFRKRINH